jgi:anaphase-promoting complex subunit 6
LARKYFSKANKLDKNFAPGWIAFGHAYSSQDESDPAMAAYRTAARLFPGCHHASLYIGMEYMRMNNNKTALLEFKQAHKLNETDPMVLNEMGVVYYH